MNGGLYSILHIVERYIISWIGDCQYRSYDDEYYYSEPADLAIAGIVAVVPTIDPSILNHVRHDLSLSLSSHSLTLALLLYRPIYLISMMRLCEE